MRANDSVLTSAIVLWRLGDGFIAIGFLASIGYFWWCAITGARGPRLRAAIGVFALLVAALAPAAYSARPRPRCAMAGDTLARTSQIRVVATETSNGVVVRGCAFATNRVRVLDRVEVAPSVERRAGTWVALRGWDQGGPAGGGVKVADVRSGRSYDVVPRVDTRHQTLRYFMNDLGQTVAGLRSSFPPPAADGTLRSTTAIRAFSSRGATRLVDEGNSQELELESLVLDRRLFVWTHSGQVRYAFLAG